MAEMNLKQHKSIRKRVVLQVSVLISAAIIFITLSVAMLVHQHMSAQMRTLLQNKTYATQQRLEQRLRYLVENSILLTKNEFMINGLLDSIGRETYLPPLVKNFMEGKDVISLSVVDFDGYPIYKTRDVIPDYKTSPQLRAALAMGQVTLYLQSNSSEIVLVAPIRYYETTQGAVVVVFDLNAMVKRQIPPDELIYLKLTGADGLLFSYGYNSSSEYISYLLPSSETLYLNQLGITMEMGIPESSIMAPVQETLLRLGVIGLIFVLFSAILATFLANSITRPILELYRRVNASDASKNILCSPIGTDDELEALARAFDKKTLLLQYQAEHDALTELPNRVLFLDRLEQSIKHASQEKGKIALFFIDLDRFKEVNDSFGHLVGDKLLKEVALHLMHLLGSNDTIARMGGDEFTLLIDRISGTDAVADLISRIMTLFQRSWEIESHQFYISCSIGIALYPQNGVTPQELLKNADAAMYRAKAEGRNTYQFYTSDMTEKAFQRVRLQTELRHAIEREELEVYFQPKVDMRDQRIIGMEALIRWHHATMGLVSPALFIPMAEETGLIVEIDRWVMLSAAMQFAKWYEAGLSPGVLSLNLSLLQLHRNDFIAFIEELMLKSGMKAEHLELEITETQVMKNPEYTITMLHQLKALKIALAIDDFGTGQSSLAYLKRLPLDRIKIDQSFVRDIPDDHDDVVLTRTIIAMARSLDLKLIAEGVETTAQSEFLIGHHCYEAQGYLYYRPMPASAVEKVLQSLL